MTGVMYRLRWLAAGAFVLALAAPLGLSAQGNPDPYGFKFNNGQGVQPIFEGWSHNADGTFEMWYGYYNKNFQETLVVQVGADNKVGLATAAPGSPDHGQPTVFLPRIHRMAFSVTVPADFAKKEMVWSVTVRGETEKALGWLQREWEIDPIYFGKMRNAESLKNKKPTLTVNVPATATVGSPVTLASTVVDDGLPTPRKAPRTSAVGQETPPSLKPLPDQPEIPTNVPGVGGRGGGGGAAGGGLGPQAPTVNWIVWRGPAAATITPGTMETKEQKAEAKVTFTKAGTYVLRATGSDSELKDVKDVTITVN